MIDWEVIMADAEQIAREFRQHSVDLNEAEKAGDFYLTTNCDDAEMARYLELLATDPPERSKQSLRHYLGIRRIWENWNTSLEQTDKARAWLWGVRLAKSR